MPVLTTVITHATGDVYPASDWNTYNRDDLNYLIAAGADLASAATIITTNEFHAVTGVTTIDNLSPVTPVAGQRIRLWIKGGPLTIRNNGGGTGNVRTVTGGDRTYATNAIVEFAYDATNSVWREVAPAPTTYKKTAATTVVNTITATDLLGGTMTLAALQASSFVRLDARGDWINNTGGAVVPPRFQLLLGGTILLDTGSGGAVMSTSGGRWGWKVDATIANLGATNSQWSEIHADGSFADGVGGAAANFNTGEGNWGVWLTAGGLGHLIAEGGGASAVDTSAARLLELRVILGTAAATVDAICKHAAVEVF